MTEFQSIQGRRVLFLLVDGFESANFEILSDCLRRRGADVLVASFNRDDILTSKNRFVRVKSVISFVEAAQKYYDAVVIADNTTAHAIRKNIAAMELIEETWGRGNVVATVDEGAIDLIGAGIVDNKVIAAPPTLYEDLENSGAEVPGTPIAVSGNILSARADADLSVFCNDIVDHIAGGAQAAA